MHKGESTSAERGAATIPLPTLWTTFELPGKCLGQPGPGALQALCRVMAGERFVVETLPDSDTEEEREAGVSRAQHEQQRTPSTADESGR